VVIADLKAALAEEQRNTAVVVTEHAVQQAELERQQEHFKMFKVRIWQPVPRQSDWTFALTVGTEIQV